MFESSLIDTQESTRQQSTGPLTLFGYAVAVFLGNLMFAAFSAIAYFVHYLLVTPR